MFGLETLTKIAQGKVTLDEMISEFGKPAMMKAGHKVFMVKLVPVNGKDHSSKKIEDYNIVTEAYKESLDDKIAEMKQKFLDLHEFTEALKKEHAELIKLYNSKK